MKNSPIPKKHYPRIKTCTHCNLSSKEIYFSTKFQKNLCLDCLTQLMLDQIRSTDK